jgi:multicomponent Na+:H+ antiporter subunit E
MKALVWNLVLALVWLPMTGRFSFSNLLLGFAVGYLVLFMSSPGTRSTSYFRKVLSLLRFALFFAKEVLLSALRVAYDVLTPTHHMRPGVIGIPLDAKTDVEITLLANIVTLTPGTLSLDVSADRRTLYIHAMYLDDPDRVRLHVKAEFERRLLELAR